MLEFQQQTNSRHGFGFVHHRSGYLIRNLGSYWRSQSKCSSKSLNNFSIHSLNHSFLKKRKRRKVLRSSAAVYPSTFDECSSWIRAINRRVGLFNSVTGCLQYVRRPVADLRRFRRWMLGRLRGPPNFGSRRRLRSSICPIRHNLRLSSNPEWMWIKMTRIFRRLPLIHPATLTGKLKRGISPKCSKWSAKFSEWKMRIKFIDRPKCQNPPKNIKSAMTAQIGFH